MKFVTSMYVFSFCFLHIAACMIWLCVISYALTPCFANTALEMLAIKERKKTFVGSSHDKISRCFFFLKNKKSKNVLIYNFIIMEYDFFLFISKSKMLQNNNFFLDFNHSRST